jgi:hypothetical protein
VVEEMNEATLRNYVRKGLHAKGVLTTHHEDALNSGIPDLSYSGGVNGWIELKWLEAWPKREATIVKIDHYTKEQRYFLLSRGRAGGRCWLLLRVGREHLLFDHEGAQKVGTVNYAHTAALCFTAWPGFIDFEQLTRILTR